MGLNLPKLLVLGRESKIVVKIVSFNATGLGGRVKKRELMKLVSGDKLDMLCVQETKLENITQRVCNSIWADNDFGWSFLPSIGRSGGILFLWNVKSFKLHQSFVGSNFIGLQGCWGGMILNVFLFLFIHHVMELEKEGCGQKLLREWRKLEVEIGV